MFVRLHVITWRDNTQEQPQQSEMLCVNRLTGGPPFFILHQFTQDAVLQKHALRQKTQHVAVKSGKAMAAQCFKECHLPLREAPAPALLQRAKGKARRKPQLQHDIVFPCAGAVLLVGRRPGQKLCRALRAEKAPAAKAAVGVRAKAQVVLAVPVQQVVPAGEAGLCEVGYLILGVAARGQRVCAGKVKPGGPVCAIREAKRPGRWNVRSVFR